MTIYEILSGREFEALRGVRQMFQIEFDSGGEHQVITGMVHLETGVIAVIDEPWVEYLMDPLTSLIQHLMRAGVKNLTIQIGAHAGRRQPC